MSKFAVALSAYAVGIIVGLALSDPLKHALSEDASVKEPDVPSAS